MQFKEEDIEKLIAKVSELEKQVVQLKKPKGFWAFIDTESAILTKISSIGMVILIGMFTLFNIIGHNDKALLGGFLKDLASINIGSILGLAAIMIAIISSKSDELKKKDNMHLIGAFTRDTILYTLSNILTFTVGYLILKTGVSNSNMIYLYILFTALFSSLCLMVRSMYKITRL